MAKAAGGSSSAKDVFDIDRIQALVGLMEERGLSEVELTQSDQHIRLVRGIAVSATTAPPAAPPQPVLQSAPPAAGEAAPAADGPHIKLIKSPMVGTYYSRPNPKSEDFVKRGSKVSPETVVCIVEAMKVFNEIPAEISGTIVEILVENEQPVDYDRPLFKVDTRG